MTQNEIIELAKQAGDDWDSTLSTDKEFLEAFAKLVAEAQREKSANLILELDLCGQEMKAANVIRAGGHI